MPPEGEGEANPRLLLPGFLPQSLCKELEFIHRSCCAVGYRPGVLSTTLSHLIATGCAHLVVPFVPVRERLREKVEERFGCEFELFVEFTGLVSWCKGASIGWHSDDNRPYLKQRDFAAVCYLNSCGKDFTGGIFHFKDGSPGSIIPHAGDAVIYTADSQNIHSVDEVIDGERLTLTLWFTRDKTHDEDAKLISLLSERSPENGETSPRPTLPIPAPNSMYWFPHQGSGFDIRWGRLHILGYDPLEQLMGPLQLGKGKEIFDAEFLNILHALQIVQFYDWKTSGVEEQGREDPAPGRALCPSPVERASSRSPVVGQGDPQAADSVLGSATGDDVWSNGFDLAGLRNAMVAWEEYVRALDEVLRRSFPLWRTNEIMFPVSDAGHSD
ncbi:unnamed protein product [Spirodela intermedia]|uniref:procollagen-proline 3-dioxygenase n=1 Tax=Spirodela intermedia TaxID=51605 RepID=A0A7I8J284_SPIIN|nr:unnamed protein product [Spirodela intermedia]CAA6664268.1 unnamed protein product [Spirodela intermedia]